MESLGVCPGTFQGRFMGIAGDLECFCVVITLKEKKSGSCRGRCQGGKMLCKGSFLDKTLYISLNFNTFLNDFSCFRTMPGRTH